MKKEERNEEDRRETKKITKRSKSEISPEQKTSQDRLEK